MDLAAGGSARFQFASDQSLLVYFDGQVRQDSSPDPVGTGADRPPQRQFTLQASENVRKLLRLLESEPVAGIRNLHPAYCSLLVKFDALRMRHDELEAILRKYLERLEEVKLPEPRRVEIAVCYGGEFGPDLAEVCVMRGITKAQAIELHASVEYLVYFLGFVPGFAYLGELPKELLDVLPNGFVLEVSPVAEQWYLAAAKILRNGKLVTIDYGLTTEEILVPERTHGTLRAYYKHAPSSDVLARPGMQDITAHVNFSALQVAGESSGLRTEAFSWQEQFLTGIATLQWNKNASGDDWTAERTRQFQTLTHPEQMGRKFRVLVQSRGQVDPT